MLVLDDSRIERLPLGLGTFVEAEGVPDFGVEAAVDDAEEEDFAVALVAQAFDARPAVGVRERAFGSSSRRGRGFGRIGIAARRRTSRQRSGSRRT